ncbi:MAG TPA: phenylacetate--CoA ligase [Nitrososphaerales archaeon]|nr:phenylacetate--CoA ligase [Nitrososphaerales archaeon]
MPSSNDGRRDRYFNTKMEMMPRKELVSLQEKRFRAAIKYARENSVFYKRAFRRLGIGPEDVRSIADLQKRGFFTTKDDMRKTFPYGLLAVPREQVVEVHSSSGTTGTPVLGLHTEKDLEDWGEISARCLTMAGITKKDVFQITPGFGMFSGGFGFYHGARTVGCTIVPAAAGFSKRQIQFMLDFGTTMFSSIVSYAFRLAQVAEEMGVDLPKQTKVRKGIFGSEIWTKESKRKLSKLWDMDPYDVYGFAEMYGPGMGNDCRMHDGLHLWQDFFLVEVVDPKTGEPLGPEEEGELVITTLRKNANPLIRYRCRDVSFLYDSSTCDCGRTHQKYKEIVGRTDDMVKISGVNFWPSEVESVLLRTEMVGAEYRIRLSKVNFEDKVKIEVESASKMGDKESKDKLSRELASELHNTLLFTPEVEILDPGTLPRVEVGKAQRMLDERKAA